MATGARREYLRDLAPLIVGITANAIIALYSMSFSDVPPGARIRPMDWAGLMFLVQGAAFILGLVFSLTNIFKRRRGILLSILGMATCCTPFLVGFAILGHYQHTLGFTLAE